MSRRTYTWNAFESDVVGGLNAGVLTVTLSSTSGLSGPGYLVIDPDFPAKREWIKFTNVNGSTLEGLTRNLAGSVGDISHDPGAKARAVFTHQVLNDLFLDIGDNEAATTNHAANAADPHSAAGYLKSSVLTSHINDAGDPHAAAGYLTGTDLIPYLPKAGGTMTGNLTLVGDPVSVLHAATKQYVDSQVGTISSDWADITNKPSTFPPSTHVHDAADINTGVLADARIPTLDASKISTGIFVDARIPSLAASKITSGAFDAARIPSLDASKIGTGTLAYARLPVGTGSTQVAQGSHVHDSRYYTESEMDSKLSDRVKISTSSVITGYGHGGSNKYDNQVRNVTVSDVAPTLGNMIDGDVYLKYA